MLISLGSSGQIAPNYWLDPQNGVNYLWRSRPPSATGLPAGAGKHADGRSQSPRPELLRNLGNG